MNESAQTYHPKLLQERRAAQSKQIFRRRLGVLAVSAAVALPMSAAGGARPFVHNAVDFVKDRTEMDKAAFVPTPKEQANQTEKYLEAHPNQAEALHTIQNNEASQ